jgi:hypothetical protein
MGLALRARLLQGLSPVGLFACALSASAVCTALIAFVYFPERMLLAREQRDSALTAQEKRRLSSQSISGAPTASLDAAFLALNELTSVSRTLHEIQEKYALKLVRTSFKDDLTSATLPPNIEIQMVVRGPYVQVRKMALSSLNAIQALSLQNVDIKAEPMNASDPQATVDAVLTMRLFIKAAP